MPSDARALSPGQAPCLPHQDAAPLERQEAIRARREQYVWDHGYLPPFALMREHVWVDPTPEQLEDGWKHQLPEAEWPGEAYLLGRAATTKKATESINASLEKIGDSPRFSSFEDFSKLFQDGMPAPESMTPWLKKDRGYFAWQRVAGLNPMAIHKLSRLPAKLAVDDARLEGVLPAGRTLAELAAAGRLFVCDYGILEGLSTPPTEPKKHVVPAIGLFFSDDQGALQAAAIQLGQQPIATDVHTPRDGAAWELAQTVLQSADGNVHEMGTHLCRIHFVLEAVIVATARTVSVRHPVSVLLQPHFRYVVFNNLMGREQLINQKGVGTALLAGGEVGNRQLLARSYSGHLESQSRGWSWSDWDHPLELASRGFDQDSTLKEYPFRDDGLLLWDAIGRFVAQYIDVYYPSDADVAVDSELQAWMTEMGERAGGHLAGTPACLETRAELVRLLQRIIWASGPLHSSVNYPQYGQVAFTPNMTLALFAPPPANAGQQSGDALTQVILNDLLPTVRVAAEQVLTMWSLAGYRFDALGHYQPGDFPDPRVGRCITEFQASLERAGREIDSRNARRTWTYEYLKPTLVLNSSSI